MKKMVKLIFSLAFIGMMGEQVYAASVVDEQLKRSADAISAADEFILRGNVLQAFMAPSSADVPPVDSAVKGVTRSDIEAVFMVMPSAYQERFMNLCHEEQAEVCLACYGRQTLLGLLDPKKVDFENILAAAEKREQARLAGNELKAHKKMRALEQAKRKRKERYELSVASELEEIPTEAEESSEKPPQKAPEKGEVAAEVPNKGKEPERPFDGTKESIKNGVVSPDEELKKLADHYLSHSQSFIKDNFGILCFLTGASSLSGYTYMKYKEWKKFQPYDANGKRVRFLSYFYNELVKVGFDYKDAAHYAALAFKLGIFAGFGLAFLKWTH